jgi:Insulin-induced protein (INSIG)
MITQRKLPWQSTLQVSLTLALVNPVLWYLVDRSKSGFILSTVVGIAGTFALLGINPNILPSPAILPHTVRFANISGHEMGLDGLISEESIGVWTWIASVLFCSCVCFGNIGRRLALSQQSAMS